LAKIGNIPGKPGQVGIIHFCGLPLSMNHQIPMSAIFFLYQELVVVLFE
jgi:hypothetical protein